MSDRPIVKKYTDQDITVVWKPNLCIHSEKCFHGLPEVFNPQNRPWINIDGAKNEQITEQIKQCPSGALSFYFNNEGAQAEEDNKLESTQIDLLEHGPMIVHGHLSIKGLDGTIEHKSGKTALCRCGASGNKPFCDGSHSKVGFTG